jgi:hypothetical protein
MGELLDKLERASKGAVQPLGFGAGARREKIAPVLLIGVVEPGNDAQAKLAVESGLDAVIVGAGQANGSAIDKAVKGAKGTVAGVWRDQAAETDPEGADFQVFSSDATPVGALSGEKRTNIMQVVPEWEDSQLRTIELLPVDGFLVSLKDSPSLTVSQLMRLARVRGVTSRWLLAHLAELPTKAEAEQLRDVGVAGIVVDVAGRTADALKSCKDTLLELPRNGKRRDRSTYVASIGSSGFQPPSPGRRREPEPEPDEDDD